MPNNLFALAHDLDRRAQITWAYDVMSERGLSAALRVTLINEKRMSVTGACIQTVT